MVLVATQLQPQGGMCIEPETTTRSAFVGVVGRPSSGKSTLVNRLCGAPVSLVSHFPQSTRNKIRGIVTRGETQLVLVDTPGRHLSEKYFNKRLTKCADEAMAECDILLYMIDASREPGNEERNMTASIAARGDGAAREKTIVAVNKMDKADDDAGAKEKIEAFLAENLPEVPPERVFYISALTGEGVDGLFTCLAKCAPVHPFYYPADIYTDQDIPFRVAEVVRGAALGCIREELPHALYVETADCELRDGTLFVRVFIHVEQDSQRVILIGAKGAVIRKIIHDSVEGLRQIFDWYIDLDVSIKVSRAWRHDKKLLSRIIH